MQALSPFRCKELKHDSVVGIMIGERLSQKPRDAMEVENIDTKQYSFKKGARAE